MGILDLMSIGISAIRAQQAAMEVTAHNVANINTQMYSKEEAQLVTKSPRNESGVYLGTGVNISAVKRTEDRFLNRSMFLGNMDNGYYSSKASSLGEIEEVFNEATEDVGLDAAISDFWTAWSDLANNPEGSAERANLQGLTDTMTSRFHTTYERLSLIQSNLNLEVKDSVTDINNLLNQIAEVNVQISNIENTGADASDYRTTRNVLMGELSQKIDFKYFESDDGAVHINAGNGRSLVEGSVAGQLEARADPTNNNFYDVIFVSANGKEVNLTDEIEGGELGGILEVRDVNIENTKDELNQIAYTIASEVNAQHELGTNLNGDTGVDFFTPLATVDRAAELITLDPGIDADLNAIAAGQSTSPGDNTNANAIAEISNQATMSGGTATIQEYLSTMVGNLGIDVQNATAQYEQSSAMVDQIANYRDSVTGVSLEEELSNLMKYQQAFQAAARILNSATDLVDILNQMQQ